MVYYFGTLTIAYIFNNDSQLQTYNLVTRVTTGGEVLDRSVQLARQSADYLIATNPTALFILGPSAFANELLAATAELAYLKNGILGYLGSSDSAQADMTIENWGREMRGSDGIPSHWPSNGYLLIVGETEVIGSFTDIISHLTLTDRQIHYSDNNYGDTNGDLEPDVMVGCILGDDVNQVLIPINNPIQVARHTTGHVFDRSAALLIAGSGCGEDTFEINMHSMSGFFDDRFNI